MKILHISDTHSHHRQLQDLPAADVIVHSGDFTMVGTEAEVNRLYGMVLCLAIQTQSFHSRKP